MKSKFGGKKAAPFTRKPDDKASKSHAASHAASKAARTRAMRAKRAK